MLISVEDLREKQRKRIIRKVYYLKKKFKNKKCYFVTITFRTFQDYMEFDRIERKKLMDNMKKNYKVYGAFSVVEAQRRGVPHVHMLVWMDKKIFVDNTFSGLYKSLGMSNIIRVKNKYVIYYLLKYMLKEEEREKIQYKNKQRFYNFYLKGKRKNKEWVLLSLSGVNKIIKKYDLKKQKIEGYNYVNIGGCIVKYKIFSKFTQEGLYIYNVHVVDFKEDYEVWLEDFPNKDYIEFLRWFESLIITKLNLN
jgi:hypothetical protein